MIMAPIGFDKKNDCKNIVPVFKWNWLFLVLELPAIILLMLINLEPLLSEIKS